MSQQVKVQRLLLECVKNLFSPQIQIFEPFGSSVDPSRTNMSAKQILQVLTSRMSEIPYILNKAYRDFTEVKSPFTLRAESDGVVLCNQFDILFIYYKDTKDPTDQGRLCFEYIPQMKLLMSNSLPLKFVRDVGPFSKDDLLFDYSGQTEEGIPRIGLRTNVLYAPFLGYNAEDAMVISESYSKRAQVDIGEKLYIPITNKFRYLKNSSNKYFYKKGSRQIDKNFLKYIKIDNNMIFDSQFLNISEEESLYYTQYKEGLQDAQVLDVKLHRINPATFKEVANKYIYSPELIVEISELYSDHYQEMKEISTKYESLNLGIKELNTYVNQLLLTYKTNPKLPNYLINQIAEDYMIVAKDIDYIIEIDLLQTVPTFIGDKFANSYAGKGTISMIVPDELMPLDHDGNKVDLIFNPLGIYGRNNWGTIFEIGCSKIIEDVQINTIAAKTQEDIDLIKEKLQMINDLFISKFDQEYSEQIDILLSDWNNNFSSFRMSVEKIGFYLCVDNFPELSYHEFYTNFVEVYVKKYKNIVIEQTDYKFSKELLQYVKDTRGYDLDFMDLDEDVETRAFFGKSYYLKLFHTADSKYNAVAQASTYNKTSGQPARGRKSKGGVHVSWQTENADCGHCDNSFIMTELRTIKSDCLEDKDIFLKEKTLNGKYYLQNSGMRSPTFNVLNDIMSLYGFTFVSTPPEEEISRYTEVKRLESERIIKQELEKLNLSIKDDNFELNDEIQQTSLDELEELIQFERNNSYIDTVVGKDYSNESK